MVQPAVLQIVPALGTGGAERSAVDVAIAAKQAGWRSYVASEGGRLVSELERAEVDHISLPLGSKSPLRMWRNVARIQDIIATRDIDIVHARSRAPAWSAWAATRRSKRLFVTTFHGYYGAENAWRRRYNRVMTQGSPVIAASEFIARHIRTTYGVDRRRIVIIPRGTDMGRFDPAAVAAERMKRLARDWRLPEAKPVVMLPGRLTRWKGQSVLIEAIGLLQNRDLVVLLVGGGDKTRRYRRELEGKIEDLGLHDVIRLTGDCSDMPAAYCLADLVVSASTEAEAFGRIAVEAQAMGCPTIATDHGGSRETILDGRTGWLVPPGDPRALARAIEVALASHRARSESAKAERREHAVANFSLERMCRATIEVYSGLLGQ